MASRKGIYKSRTHWKTCPLCGDEFLSEKTTYCPDCKRKAFDRGISMEEYVARVIRDSKP